MRRARLAAAALGVLASLSACSTPAPCTRALCPTGADASYRVTGWSGTVPAGAGAPALPVAPDSSVEVESGSASFTINGATVTAPSGASFLFSLSTQAPDVPLIAVSSGTLTVALPPAVTFAVPPGRTVALPSSGE